MLVIKLSSCVYCGQDATCEDHIIPKQNKTVPSCWECNCVANDKIFKSFEEKAYWLLHKALLKNRVRLEILTLTIPLMMNALYNPITHSYACLQCNEPMKNRPSNSKYCGAYCAGKAGRFQRRCRPS